MLSIDELLVAWEYRDTLTKGNGSTSDQDRQFVFFLVHRNRECGYAL